ncbi:ABC transporter ATP-binding protein [Terrilactibacillus laevilacticus]|uniref:ABC transporter ATP-binding protein n=1 Tax=Terrilactibacillus laevilacticus TaxID=1380157 RepID=A0ABW5PLQ9_9BACI|nr:ABC transporter ATP-binding protein [Terrilactibacillus laevilacticus]
MNNGSTNILEIENLTTTLRIPGGKVSVVEGISFNVKAGEKLVIVGESGSGKSMTINSILQMVPDSLIDSYKGIIKIDGENILEMSKRKFKDIRGKKISLVAQNAMTSLDPSYKIGKQVMEIYRHNHKKASKEEAKKETLILLDKMGIKNPEHVFHSYPHELSGGLRQRVVIAMALTGNPKLIIADEPTSALDPTLQLQILDLLNEINQKFGTSILMITHDFGVVSYFADRVIVMYAGEILEMGTVDEVINYPLHPYTKGLLKCIPDLSWLDKEDKIEKRKLSSISGEVPNLAKKLTGCRFAPRVSDIPEDYHESSPKMHKITDTHWVRCTCYQYYLKDSIAGLEGVK